MVNPNEVPDALVYQVARALAEARWGELTVDDDPEVVEVMDEEARALLAAVYDDIAVAALEEFAEFIRDDMDEPWGFRAANRVDRFIRLSREGKS